MCIFVIHIRHGNAVPMKTRTDCSDNIFFPKKGTDLSVYSEQYLDAVAGELNDRPRQTLNFDIPYHRFTTLINNSVATITRNRLTR